MAAAPGERIELRDSIAAYEREAIPPMTSWLRDKQLGAFAVRVLSKIGEDRRHARAVLEALQAVDPGGLSDPAVRDVSDAIARLAPKHGGDGKQPVPEPWPRDLRVTALEWRFHEAMLEIFKLAGEATRRRHNDGTFERGYWAHYFLRGVRNHGGLVYAHRLLHKEGTTEGFERLKAEGRLDLTVEALVLRPEYAGLFSEEELGVASRRIGGRR